MARPREFDKTEVVAQAAELFRAKGFEATSMRDLIAHLGLSSSSIYGAFGGKRGLFLAALKHAAAQDRALIQRTLEHSPGVASGLEALFNGLIDNLVSDEYPAASLTLKAALESLDDEVLAFLKGHIAELIEVLSVRLAMADSEGGNSSPEEHADLALFLLMSIFNLNFVVKLTRDRQRLAAYVRAALAALPADAKDSTPTTPAEAPTSGTEPS